MLSRFNIFIFVLLNQSSWIGFVKHWPSLCLRTRSIFFMSCVSFIYSNGHVISSSSDRNPVSHSLCIIFIDGRLTNARRFYKVVFILHILRFSGGDFTPPVTAARGSLRTTLPISTQANKVSAIPKTLSSWNLSE